MKKILTLFAISVLFASVSTISYASQNYMTPGVKVAIKKYKAGNYTGCLQDTQAIVRHDPSNTVAYYYMAMSYAQAGRKDKAIESYNKVLSLKSNTLITGYAQTGLRCLETPDKCKEDGSTEMDKAVASPYGDGLSNKVRNELEIKRLQSIKNQINSDAELDEYKLRQFKDYTKHKSDAKTEHNVLGAASNIISNPNVDSEVKAQNNTKQPTNDEIVAAIRVLHQAGLNPYAQAANPMAMNYQNPEMAQLGMLMQGNQGNSNSNNMMNMLPYMMAQGKNGESSPYSAQIMQSMIMGSMLPDFTLKTNDNN